LNEVSEACNTAIDFMNNLLLYEKIDTMELPLYLKREDLSAVCAQVLNSFQMAARQLEVNVSLDIHESLSAAESGAVVPVSSEITPIPIAFSKIDGPKVVIVLRNLMSNALKFTPKGGHVSLHLIPVNISPSTDSSSSSNVNLPPSLPAETTHFRVILSDTGRGMSQEEQKQLFTKIVQFSPNEIQQGGGSGIGLFLSHQIMASHKLTIQVHSEGINGSGTQFFMDFPVILPDDDTIGLRESRCVETKARRSAMSSLCPCFFCFNKSTIHDTETANNTTVSDSIFDETQPTVDVLSMPKTTRCVTSLCSRFWL
jgi:signal transduction histidine kinase